MKIQHRPAFAPRNEPALRPRPDFFGMHVQEGGGLVEVGVPLCLE